MQPKREVVPIGTLPPLLPSIQGQPSWYILNRRFKKKNSPRRKFWEFELRIFYFYKCQIIVRLINHWWFWRWQLKAREFTKYFNYSRESTKEGMLSWAMLMWGETEVSGGGGGWYWRLGAAVVRFYIGGGTSYSRVLSGREGSVTCGVCDLKCKKDSYGSSSHFFLHWIELFNFHFWVIVDHCCFFSCERVADTGRRISLPFILCAVKVLNYFVIMNKLSIWQSPAVGSRWFFCTGLFSYKYIC